jgi:hypothetical protein
MFLLTEKGTAREVALGEHVTIVQCGSVRVVLVFFIV